MRLATNQYVRIVKNVLNLNKHETLILQGFRPEGMAKLTQVVNVLSNWGYICVVRIKTRPDPALKITVKRSTDFQKNYDEFSAQLQQRREERDRLKAEQKASAASPDDQQEEEESKDATNEAPPAEPTAAESTAAADEGEAAQEMTKA